MMTMVATRSDHCPLFASVPYANAAPLAHFIPEVFAGALLSYDFPSKLYQKLAQQKADVAIIPVAEMIKRPELQMIKGLGICARHKVQSVLLKCRRPLANIQKIELDPASRTSNTLIAILLCHLYQKEVEYCFPSPGCVADAQVVIGDRALSSAPGIAGDLDLAEEWEKLTGLPFVFAVWGFLSSYPHTALITEIAQSALKQGLSRLDELAQIYAIKAGISKEACHYYLSKIIYYEIGAKEEKAIQLFKELAKTISHLLPSPSLID